VRLSLGRVQRTSLRVQYCAVPVGVHAGEVVALRVDRQSAAVSAERTHAAHLLACLRGARCCGRASPLQPRRRRLVTAVPCRPRRPARTPDDAGEGTAQRTRIPAGLPSPEVGRGGVAVDGRSSRRRQGCPGPWAGPPYDYGSASAGTDGDGRSVRSRRDTDRGAGMTVPLDIVLWSPSQLCTARATASSDSGCRSSTAPSRMRSRSRRVCRSASVGRGPDADPVRASHVRRRRRRPGPVPPDDRLHRDRHGHLRRPDRGGRPRAGPGIGDRPRSKRPHRSLPVRPGAPAIARRLYAHVRELMHEVTA
jgi:hypothetical protein